MNRAPRILATGLATLSAAAGTPAVAEAVTPPFSGGVAPTPPEVHHPTLRQRTDALIFGIAQTAVSESGLGRLHVTEPANNAVSTERSVHVPTAYGGCNGRYDLQVITYPNANNTALGTVDVRLSEEIGKRHVKDVYMEWTAKHGDTIALDSQPFEGEAQSEIAAIGHHIPGVSRLTSKKLRVAEKMSLQILADDASRKPVAATPLPRW